MARGNVSQFPAVLSCIGKKNLMVVLSDKLKENQSH